MKVVFFGTPEFAVASLKSILDAGFNVVGIVTMPDKPAGRGMHLQQSAVKKFAVENNLKVLQPEKLKDIEFISELKSLNADIQVVIAFRMLPEIVWNMPRFGTMNLHASLLPDYRGAAPINHAIINGESKTGVTTFFLKHEIDTGDILLQKEVEITPSMNAGELHDKLMEVGARLVVDSLKMVEKGNSGTNPQSGESIKFAPKIFKDHCKIDWDKSCNEIFNLVRGLSPYPAALTDFNGKILKVFESKPEIMQHEMVAGTFVSDNKTFLKVACMDGFVHLLDVQIESKKRMKIDEFLRGHKVY